MLDEHWGYIADPVRLDRFRRAIRAVAKPGDRVADLGCGSGVLTLLALEAGAGHVYAIDRGRMLTVARETVTRCGFADRVSFIQGRSQTIELPERVDVVLCDHVGWFGVDYGIINLLSDARRRFLKRDGVLVPGVLGLELAAVESEACRAAAERWTGTDVPAAYRWLRQSAINSKHSAELEASELLSGPVHLATLDLRDDQPDFLTWHASLRAERDGVVHGLAGWFDCELAGGICMTNSPLVADRIDRPQVFLPCETALRVSAGDAVNATITARPADRLLGWSIAVPATGQRFTQSTWQGRVLESEDLVRSSPDRVPRPSREAAARAVVLGYCDGKRSIQDIEAAVLRDHPALFPSRAEISSFVVEVLCRDAVL